MLTAATVSPLPDGFPHHAAVEQYAPATCAAAASVCSPTHTKTKATTASITSPPTTKYFQMFYSAAGGGVNIALMALYKNPYGSLGFSPFVTSLVGGHNYGISFVIIHMLPAVATKPATAMTAASFAEQVVNKAAKAMDNNLAKLLIDVCRSQKRRSLRQQFPSLKSLWRAPYRSAMPICTLTAAHSMRTPPPASSNPRSIHQSSDPQVCRCTSLGCSVPRFHHRLLRQPVPNYLQPAPTTALSLLHQNHAPQAPPRTQTDIHKHYGSLVSNFISVCSWA